MNGFLFPGEGEAVHRIEVSKADFSYKEEGANVHEGLGYDDHVSTLAVHPEAGDGWRPCRCSLLT